MNLHQPSKSSGFLWKLGQAWNWLTRPADAIQDVALRRKSRLLAGFLLFMTAIFIGVDLAFTLTVPGYAPPWLGYIFLGTAYLLNRLKYYGWAAALTLAMFPLIIFGQILTNQVNSPIMTLNYLVLSLFLSSIFLSVRGTAMLAVINITGILLLPILAPATAPEFNMIIRPLAIITIGAVLVLTSMIHRNQIEVERQAEVQTAHDILREREAYLRSILNNMPFMMWLKDIDGHFLTVNQAVVQAFGAPDAQSFVGKTDWDLSPPEMAEKYLADDQEVIKTKQQKFIEELINDAQGPHWFATYKTPILDEQGQVLGTTGFAMDVTERKLAEEALKTNSERLEEMVAERTGELQEAQERLIRQEKLALLGQLAGSVGHELRNPLGVITNAVYFLQMTLAEADEKVKEYLDLIAERVHEADKVVADLLNLSRTRLATQEQVIVSELVEELLQRCPPPEGVIVHNTIPFDLPPILVDPQQIMLVLTNLITNAYQAMPTGGQLMIEAQPDHTSVKILVADTGVGMSPETKRKIFEPLYTTKPKGIGLGLAVSKNLVEINHGTIEVESIAGGGTTFTLVLPVYRKEASGE